MRTPVRHAALGAAFLLAAGCGGSSGDFQVQDASVDELRAAIVSGRISCREATRQTLARIEALNRQGPMLRAVIEVQADALSMADELDRRQRVGSPLGPLHCVPLLVKDNFNTGDGLATTAGSLVMDEYKAPADAVPVARLRAAGALPVAKTNMDEWASGAFGYSSRGGQTLNAHRLNRIPGGSSGGSAVGVAAGLGMLATGSDTGGSIRIPSAVNGVVGIKPTMGRVARTGVIPSSSALDVVGPIARSVADAALMLGILSGQDADDPASAGRGPVDFRPALDAQGLRGARIGVLTAFSDQPLAGANAEFDAALARALEVLQSRGAVLVPGLTVPPVANDDELLAMVRTLALARFREEIEGYLSTYRHPTLRSLDDVVNRSRALGPDVMRNLAALEAGAQYKYSQPEWDAAQARRTQLVAAVNRTMDEAGVDALVFLTLTCPATPLPGVVDPGFQCRGAAPMPYTYGTAFGGEAILMASLTGLPEITVPAGHTRDGVPIAVSFFGRAFDEATLIRLAYAYEQATRLRRPAALRP